MYNIFAQYKRYKLCHSLFLNNCSKTIVHKWVMCPIWKCSTPLSPLVPSLPLEHPMSSAVIVLSLLGTIMLTLIFTYVGIKVNWRWARRNHAQLMPDNRHSPIYGKNFAKNTGIALKRPKIIFNFYIFNNMTKLVLLQICYKINYSVLNLLKTQT